MRQPSRLACHSNCLRMTEEGAGNSEAMGAWQFLGNPRDKESGIFSPVHCLLPPPLRLARNALLALKMSLFCRPVSHRDACPSPRQGGFNFRQKFLSTGTEFRGHMSHKAGLRRRQVVTGRAGRSWESSFGHGGSHWQP